MVDKLAVLLFDDLVGVLSVDKGWLQFEYVPEWLSAPSPRPLSQSLPLRGGMFEDPQARPFFAGLLPEGGLRTLIAKQLNISGRNEFALLDRLGGECAGAVTLLPFDPGHGAVNVKHPESVVKRSRLNTKSAEQQIQWLNDQEVIAILDTLPYRPMLAGRDGLRLSLAGAQDKLPVVFDGERLGLPINGTPSSHIIKPNIKGLEDTVANECFCLTLASAMELQSARSQIHSVKEREFLLVERYDRILNPQGRRLRLHQEDFCQALGIVPELKYQSEGGPTASQCFELLRHVTRPSSTEVLRMLDYMVFNALVGNHDAHAKNFSLLYLRKRPVLAPLYDILSTAIYPTLTPKMAMKIGSKYKYSDVQARHWDQFAEAIQMSPAQTKKRIGELAQLLPVVARRLYSNSKAVFSGRKVVQQIVTLIEKRSASMLKKLEVNLE